MSILLASGSPQRSAILTQLGLPFRVIVPEVEERDMGDPNELALHNARLKAEAVAQDATSDELVVACDTVVDVDVSVLHPHNAAFEAHIRRVIPSKSGFRQGRRRERHRNGQLAHNFPLSHAF